MRRSSWWQALTLAVCIVVLAGADLRAEAPKPHPSDVYAYNTLREVINHGADLYNGGDWNGCYRLYEGALLSMKPFLAHRPDMQKAIDDGLARAKGNAALDRRAFDLRSVIDTIRTATNPNPKKVDPPKTTKLWDRLGGDPGVKKVVDEFVKTAGADPKVDFTRGGKFLMQKDDVARLKKNLVEQISGLTGGPYTYKGKGMKEAHKGMGITEAQFNAAAGHLQNALKGAGANPDDVKAVMAAAAATKKDIVEPKKPDPPPVTKLWDRLGGEANVKKVIDDFVGAAAADPKVNFSRGKKLEDVQVADLKKKLVEFVSSATGGPYVYKGKNMKDAHKGMGITEAEFDAAAGHLKKALEKNNAKPEDVKAVMDAVGSTRKDIVEPKKPEPPKDKPDDKAKDKPADKPKDKPADKPKDKPDDKPKGK